MKTGFILRSIDILQDDYDSTLNRIKNIKPDYVILSCTSTTDLKMFQLFSKLEIKSFPQIDLGDISPRNTIEIAKQTIIFLNSNRLYLRVKWNIEQTYIDDLVATIVEHLSSFSGLQLYIVCTAVRFFEKNSASLLFEKLKNIGLSVAPVFMFVNTERSLQIMDTDDFARSIELFPLAHFQIQLIHDNPAVSFIGFREYNREIFISNIEEYEWFLRMLYQTTPFKTDIATPLHDRTSAWEDPACVTKPTRKLDCTDSVEIVQYMGPGVARTAEGDFIKTIQFSIKKL